jgi:hypothetical protein
MQCQRGMLVRLKTTGALFEVQELKENGKIVIVSGPSRLTVSPEMVVIVPDFNYRTSSASEEVESEEVENVEARG